MQAELQAHIAFHLTGRMPQSEDSALAGNDLQPAMFAGYRDLTALRYDFPVVLMAGGDGQPVQSLTALFDSAVKKSIGASGDDQRLRILAIRLEREIRKLTAGGTAGTLLKLCDLAAARIGARDDEQLAKSLKVLRIALKYDGTVIDCDKAMPFRLFQHIWRTLQEQKAQKFRAEIDSLIMKLSDILSADFGHSKEGMSPDRLQASIGTAYRDAFDFAAMSRVLTISTVNVPMAESRRKRVRGLLAILRTQRFVPPGADSDKLVSVAEPYSFEFYSWSDAIAAYRERLPNMTELAKAMAAAKLETDGEYSEARHDDFFASFSNNSLDANDIAAFPDYLICLDTHDMGAVETDAIRHAFVVGMPAKVVLQTDDLIEQSSITDDYVITVHGRQLASAAIALGTSYVLQASGSSLYHLREQITRGLAYRGPALFSIYSGANCGSLTPYLAGAAATESRTFPAFAYDPSAGADWASRFSLAGNSQLELDWPVQRLDYEDAEQQRVSETVAFTLVDYAACDPRCAKYFVKVPRAKWTADLEPVVEFLTREPKKVTEKVPYLLMVDGDYRLQKVIVNNALVREARRCVEAWRSLQELGGIHNSHAARLLEKERKSRAEQGQTPVAAVKQQASARISTPAETHASTASTVVEHAPERSLDDPYIETARCTSCNECTQINDKMFGYDGNKQAYIINPDAGTYRQLVEAAENCQVSIIHPGKPRNPNEPGIDELIERALPFM